MPLNWSVPDSPWTIAEKSIRNHALGTLATISVQAVLPASRQADESDCQAWLSTWRKRLADLIGEEHDAQEISNPRAASAIIAYDHGHGPIVRLFVDQSLGHESGWLSFEIIGTEQSLIYRPLGSVQGMMVHGAIGNEKTKTSLLFDTPLETAHTISGPPLRLGVWNTEHPHAAGNHFPALGKLQTHVDVRAIGDMDRQRSQSWRETFDADYVESLEQLLDRDDLDAILVTSRNNFHAHDAIACASRGLHVLCDKPIAITHADGQSILRAFANSQQRFVTTYPCRFHPAVQQLRRAIRNGELGEIQAMAATNHGCMYEPDVPAWVRDPQTNGGGCIIDHTVHVADLMRWLTGEEFQTVQAKAATRLRSIPAEDIGVLHGTMTNNALFQIDASWSRKGTDPNWGDVTLRIVGSNGSASLDLYNNHVLQIYTPDGLQLRYCDRLIHDHAMIFLDLQQELCTGQRGDNADQHDGVASMNLALAAYDAIETGQPVHVPRPTGVSL